MDLILLTGPPGAGKDTVGKIMEKHGWKHLSMSQYLKEYYRKLHGKDPPQEELLQFAKKIREKEGKDIVARLLEKDLEEKTVISGVRSWEEVEFLKKRGRVVLVSVTAPEEVRKRRKEGVLEREKEEESLGLKEVMERADVVIENSGSIAELEEKVLYITRNHRWLSLGLKVGLEIHQQLSTNKLFCSCPSELVENHSLEFERYLRPVASEMGEFDPAALTEFRKGTKYIYRANNTSVCLVEMDEEPPHPPTPEALETAIMVALYMNMNIIPLVQVMRKTVIDGSNTSGFQRTMLIGVNGYVDTPMGRVPIPTLCLEEDAARVVERRKREIVYSLDRLGIPLIEISTAPSMRTPEEVKSVAERIGILLRATGRVKRGLGTIRQDINISIREGARVEIKGVQDLHMLDKYVELEAIRQEKLLQLRERIKSVEVRPPVDVTHLFSSTGSKLIKKAISRGEKVFGMRLRNGRGIMGYNLGGNRRFGSEVADYVRVHAGLGGIIHSDELPAYGITEEEVEMIRKELKCEEGDGFILFTSREGNKPFEVIKQRIEMAKKGVPEETRSPKPDGTTSYARPLPGAARMYPETDVDYIYTPPLVEKIKDNLPPLPEERKESLLSYGLSEKMVDDLIRSPYIFLFEEMVKEGIDPKLAASIILNKFPYWRREGVNIDSMEEGKWIELLKGYEKLYPKQAMDDIVKLLSEELSVEEAVDKLGVRLLSEKETEKVVKEVIEEFKEKGRDIKKNMIIGEVMKRTQGRASGKTVSKILDKLGVE